MGFNYGLEKKKFDEEWKKLRKEYEAAGMTQESIQKLYQFDLSAFNYRRAAANHEQPLCGAMVDGVDNGCEDQSALLNKFLDELSITDEYTFGTGRFSWIEKTEDDELYERLKKLDDSDKELLTLLAFDGYTRREIAKIRSVSEQAIGKRIKKLKEFLFLV